MSLITEIHGDAILIKTVLESYNVSSTKELLDQLNEVSAAAMGKADVRDWTKQALADQGRDEIDAKQQEVIKKLGGGGKDQQRMMPDAGHIIAKDGNFYVVKSVGGSKLNLVDLKTKKAANVSMDELSKNYKAQKDQQSGNVRWIFKG